MKINLINLSIGLAISLFINAVQSQNITAFSASALLNPSTEVERFAHWQSPADETIKDCDGNIYHTVKIGTQVWLLENLKTTKYRDCTPIPNVKDDAAWGQLTSGGYCDYKNVEKNAATYGRLYNWYVIGDKRGIAPEGWHVPSNAEFKTLVEFLGGQSVAGGKLKEAGFTHWPLPNKDASNTSGFTGLPGGDRAKSGSFYALGEYGYLWTSTESVKNSAFNRHLLLYSGAFEDDYQDNKCSGFSIRCIKD